MRQKEQNMTKNIQNHDCVYFAEPLNSHITQQSIDILALHIVVKLSTTEGIVFLILFGLLNATLFCSGELYNLKRDFNKIHKTDILLSHWALLTSCLHSA